MPLPSEPTASSVEYVAPPLNTLNCQRPPPTVADNATSREELEEPG